MISGLDSTILIDGLQCRISNGKFLVGSQFLQPIRIPVFEFWYGNGNGNRIPQIKSSGPVLIT